MLYEILKHIRNFFPDLDHQITGAFSVEGGSIDPFPTLAQDQYFLIEGSALNDGVYCNSNRSALRNETFTGTITPLKIPSEFEALANEIKSYALNNKPSQFNSESFGGYSYTKATKNGVQLSWQDAYRSRLNAWRKL